MRTPPTSLSGARSSVPTASRIRRRATNSDRGRQTQSTSGIRSSADSASQRALALGLRATANSSLSRIDSTSFGTGGRYRQLVTCRRAFGSVENHERQAQGDDRGRRSLSRSITPRPRRECSIEPTHRRSGLEHPPSLRGAVSACGRRDAATRVSRRPVGPWPPPSVTASSRSRRSARDHGQPAAPGQPLPPRTRPSLDLRLLRPGSGTTATRSPATTPAST